MASNTEAATMRSLSFFSPSTSSAAAHLAAPGESDTLLRALSDHTAQAISIKDCSGRIVFANRMALRMFGKCAASILGLTSGDLYANRVDADMCDAHDRAAIDNCTAVKTEDVVSLPDGVRILDSTRTAWRSDQGEILGVVCLSTDITERRHAERKLKDSEARLEDLIAIRTAELRALICHLNSVWEEEKHAIARQLHDDLGSGLTALNLHLAILFRQMPDARHLTDQSARIKALSDALTEAARRIQSGLRHGTLDVFGIKTAVAEKALAFERSSGVRCRVDLPDEALSYPPQINIALLRMVQEALNSIAGRGDATHVDVVLDDTDDEIVLVIRDNGSGLRDRTSPEGISDEVQTMCKRTVCPDGEVKITRTPGMETQVVLTLPKKARNAVI